MANTPENSDPAFIREVDEELRRDQLESMARRYGLIAIVVVLIGLAALAAVLITNARAQASREQDAEQLDRALGELGAGQGAKAQPVLAALANSRHESYRALALLAQADAAVEGGKDKDAIALYKRVADDEDYAQPFRDLARVRGAAIAFDSLSPAQVIAELGPLAKPGNPWFGSAGEMVAMAYRNSGKTDQAAKLFAMLARDQSVPDTIRTRSMQMASALGVDATPMASADAKGSK